jgi:hypothetical protein
MLFCFPILWKKHILQHQTSLKLLNVGQSKNCEKCSYLCNISDILTEKIFILTISVMTDLLRL